MCIRDRLQAEGYLIGRIGAGTRINERLLQDAVNKAAPQPRIRKLPAPIRGLPTSRPAHPFRPYEPALTEFPVETWARVAGRRLRRASSSLLAGGDSRGYAPLREACLLYTSIVGPLVSGFILLPLVGEHLSMLLFVCLLYTSRCV